jgi:hypothetical protein
MKHLLALVALAVVASGQQNDGVNGVTLTGTAQAPGIHNLSGRTVIYIILKLDYTEGPSTYLPVNFRRGAAPRPGDSPEGLPPGGVRTISTAMPTPPVAWSGNGPRPDPPKPKILTGASLDAVIFSDGEFVAPDRGKSFDQLVKQFAAERELATFVAAARNNLAKRAAAWGEVDRLRPLAPRTIPTPLTPEDSLKMGLAQMLSYTLQRQGEAAAYDLAEREMAVPKLWRAGQ